MRIRLYFLVFCIGTLSKAQGLEPSDSLQLQSKVSCLCQNFKKETYLGLSNGEILKINADGKIAQTFSYPNMSEVTHISCSNPLKIMAFYRDNQSYLLLERFNSNPRLYNITLDADKRIEFALQAPDQSLWTITTQSLELSRQDLAQSNQTLYLLTTLLIPNEEIIQFMESGNKIYLLTDLRILTFNIAGQLIEIQNIEKHCNPIIIGNHLIQQKKNAVSLFSLSDKKITEIFLRGYYQYFFELEDAIATITEDRIYYFPR